MLFFKVFKMCCVEKLKNYNKTISNKLSILDTSQFFDYSTFCYGIG